MLENIGNFVRMLVRPITTLATVGAVIYIAVGQGNKEVVTALVGMAGVVTTFWFNDRVQQNHSASLGDK